jgi:transcriptional regulator with XRE-family HTH domain
MNGSSRSVAGGRGNAGLDVVGLVRAARRRADTSQREMAEKAGVSAATIGRIEAGSLRPSLAVLEAVLAVAGIRLVAVGADNRAVPPMWDAPDGNLRDGAGRRYPSHLDVIVDPTGWDWWGGRYGLARPPETFLRDRERRDVQRRRSTWEVRVAQFRSVRPPPTVAQWLEARDPDFRRRRGKLREEVITTIRGSREAEPGGRQVRSAP